MLDNMSNVIPLLAVTHPFQTKKMQITLLIGVNLFEYISAHQLAKMFCLWDFLEKEVIGVMQNLW
jgi:hypothetical protein